MPITLDGTLGLGTPALALGGATITANAAQLNSSSEDVNSENRIINGDFNYWQRATTSTASGYVTADRWQNSTLGGTVTQSRQVFALGDTLGVTQPIAFMRQTVSGQTLASHYAVNTQPIEGVRTYAGQTITVLGWVRRFSGSGNMAVEGAQIFGTGTGQSAPVYGISPTTVLLGDTWAPFAAVMAVPSIAGKTLGTILNDSLQINFWASGGADHISRTNNLGLQTIGLDLWGIHIRVGIWSASDAALYRPRDAGTELALCERYCQIVTVSAQSPVPGSVSVPWNNRVRMRATPSLIVSRTSIAIVNASVAGDTVDGPEGGYFGILATANAGYVVGRQYRLEAEL